MQALAHRAYLTALRALDVQERALGELRQRTGTMLAASSLTASFLGAQTVQHSHGFDVRQWFAVFALAVSVGSAVYVLLPKRGFVFSLNAVALYEQLFAVEDEEEVDRRLAYWLETYWRDNQVKIDALSTYFFVSALALVLELVLWTWALASSL